VKVIISYISDNITFLLNPIFYLILITDYGTSAEILSGINFQIPPKIPEISERKEIQVLPLEPLFPLFFVKVFIFISFDYPLRLVSKKSRREINDRNIHETLIKKR
jgi:hypothetical protein